MVQRIRLDAVDDELDFRTSSIQQPTPQEPFHATPADGLEGDDEEDDPPLGLPAKSPSHAAFINPRDWIDYMPRAYAESMPRPVGLTNPGLWNPRNDEWGRYLTDEKNHATRCRHMLSRAAAAEGAEAAAAATSGSRSKSAQNTKNDRATKKRADKNKDKDKIKGKPLPGNHARKTTTPQAEEQNRRHRGERSILRWIQEGVRIFFHHNRPPTNFHNGINMHDATPTQLTFLEGELARFVESGAWITKTGDYMSSFDLQDGFYALGIAEADRDYFTVDVRGMLYMLAGLPMGWSLSPYHFVTLT
eukprot:jgi/Tetstr1/446441/TSEL_033983.t1